MQKPPYTTKQVAQIFSVKDPSVRSAYCRTGHFLGVRPFRLSNGRLMWPADQVDQIAYPNPAKQ